jgi:hypothetical protein
MTNTIKKEDKTQIDKDKDGKMSGDNGGCCGGGCH